MRVTLNEFSERYHYDSWRNLIEKNAFYEVYKAKDTNTDKWVALKIFKPGSGLNVYDFASEVRQAKQLNHPKLLKYFEAYEIMLSGKPQAGASPAYQLGVSEYADKGSLSEFLKSKKPSADESLSISRDIIAGLAFLHENKIVHGFLDSGDILLFAGTDGLDAKIANYCRAETGEDGVLLNCRLFNETLEYRAPEFFNNEVESTQKIITSAADVWGLGVIILEATIGEHPFSRKKDGLSREQIISNILLKDLSGALQLLPADLREVTAKCLVRDPLMRPQSAVELLPYLNQETSHW